MIHFADKLLFNDTDYSVRILTMWDKEILLQMCQKCSDYFYLHNGEEPGEKDAYEILKGLPEGYDVYRVLNDSSAVKGYEDKFVFGIFNEKASLIGVIDLIRDYRDKGEWAIGLLLLDPAERGNGLGQRIHNYIISLASGYQANKLLIGVVESNKKAYGFWRHLGYHEIYRVHQKYHKKDHVVIAMNKDLHS